MRSTIVSMTDMDGTTGNVDYNDCREPSESDLVLASRRYDFNGAIKFTITDAIGNKRKFIAEVVGDKLVVASGEIRDLSAINRVREKAVQAEIENLKQYAGMDYDNDVIYTETGVNRDEVIRRLDSKKKGVWALVPKRFAKEMFNCCLSEIVVEKVLDGTIQKD